MRWCSRDAGPVGSGCWVDRAAWGKDAGGPPAESNAELQPASMGASAATKAPVGRGDSASKTRVKRPDASPPTEGTELVFGCGGPQMLPSAFGRVTDLLGPRRRDARTIAFLDEARTPHPQMTSRCRSSPKRRNCAHNVSRSSP